jgi:V8-like Glu-specific endopeptidase
MNLLLRTLLLAALAAGASLPAAALDLQRLRMMTAAEQVPWRAVGRVNIVVRTDARGMCTGTLIAEDLVLTAAHCVVDDLTGLTYPVGNVHFVAGLRLGVKVAHSLAEKIAVHPRYEGGKASVRDNIPYDLALIRLKTPVPRAKAQFFPVGPVSEAPLSLVSYRRDRANALTRQDGCTVAHREDEVITLGCEVTFGASGSPLFQVEDGQARIVGVLSAMSHQSGRIFASAVIVEAAIAEVQAAMD